MAFVCLLDPNLYLFIIFLKKDSFRFSLTHLMKPTRNVNSVTLFPSAKLNKTSANCRIIQHCRLKKLNGF